MDELTLEAPAKINLRLEVLGKRPDGYHEVRLLMLGISLSDRLVLRRRPAGITLRCPAGGPESSENLAWRAAELYFAEIGVCGGVAIELEKRIPAEAGLGGGSSDAAAVLEGLDRLYGSNLGSDRLRELAGRIGSDIPFFIGGAHPAWALGRGEQIVPLAWPIPAMAVIVVKPAVGVSTALAYRKLAAPELPAQTLAARREEPLPGPPAGPLWGPAGRKFVKNDLEGPVFSLYDEIRTVKRRLVEAGVTTVLMSGSGSAVFALCSNRGRAQEVIARSGLGAGHRVFVAHSLE